MVDAARIDEETDEETGKMFSKRLLSMVPGAGRFIAADVALQLVGLLANVALFMVIGSFLEALLFGGADGEAVARLAGAAALAIVVRLACQTFAQRAGQAAAEAAKRAVRQEIYDKLVRLGSSYRERSSTSKAVQTCVDGVEQLESYFGSYLPQLFYALLASLALFACLAPLCLPAAVVLLVCVPLIPASIMAFIKVARRVVRRYWGSYTDLGALFLESIQGLTTLKIYRADEAQHARMNEEAETFRRATMRMLRMQLNSITIMDILAYGGAGAGIVVMLFQAADGSVGFGAAFAFTFLSAEFFLPLRTLGSFFHAATNGMAAADTMFEILDIDEPPEGSRGIDAERADIACRNVGYSYDGERAVLEGIDFDAPAGSFVGVTGESGSGKSTLAGILVGANANYTGRVLVGGVDARDTSRAALREAVTYVGFQSYLFKGTVRSNLALARPDATDEELWVALERCRIAGFVRAAGGLDAPVAAEGSNLSGGQRQRLAMARALLHDTPVYVFDEATSNIDAESEAAIIAFIHEIAREKTVVVISHRLSAIAQADRIYVLDHGRAVEAGPHDKLVAAGGTYARLWERQAELERLARPTADPSAGALAADAPVPAAAAPSEGAEAPKRRSHLSVMARLVGLTKPLLPVIALAVVLGVAGFAAAIFLTVFAAYALVGIFGAEGGLPLGLAGALIVACGVARGPLRYGEQLCNHYLAFKILALVRDRVFAQLRRLAPAKLEGRDKGDLVSLVTSDIELLEVFYAHTLSPAVIALVVSAGATAFVCLQSPVLGVVALASYAIIGVALPFASSKASGEGGREVRDFIGDMNSFVLEGLRGLSETLQFGAERARSSELSDRMAALGAAERSLKGKAALSMSLVGAIVVACDLVMVVAAAGQVIGGSIGFGEAFLAVAALMSSFGPVIAVANLGSTLQQTLASGARVLDLLEEDPQTRDVPRGEGVGLAGFAGAEARGVTFSYGAERVLADVSLRIPKGFVVQIAGRSGSGKSTLLKLLMRFWDVDEGAVEVSGIDVRRIATDSLREHEGFMTQDTHLFSGTIRDNIAIARAGADDAAVAEAARKAALSSFVDQLPKGLDTPVGELGDGLSGGERQRIGLARVFLHDAPFVLLDEPTSNLDALNEAAVLRALSDNRSGKTVVLVSHRPSAAAVADVRYSVDCGRLS